MQVAGDELVEEVDRDGSVLRVVRRAEMRAGRLRHRATFIAVVDADGRLLIHQRSAHKDVWPSRWDLAAGGVAGVGESWIDAARRELAEELGLTPALVPELTPLGEGTFDDLDVHVVAAVFVARIDAATAAAVRFADGEVVDAEWVTLAELDEAIRTREMCPGSIALVLPRLRNTLR